MGMLIDKAHLGFGMRSWRYAMIVEDNVVTRWYEEPEAFRPGRWREEVASRLPKVAYFPFGGGPRQCIGNSFATMEAVLLLAAIAQRFRLRLAPGHAVELLPAMSLRPRGGVRVKLERR